MTRDKGNLSSLNNPRGSAQTNEYQEEGVEMIRDGPPLQDKATFRKYMKNADRLNDEDMNSLVEKIRTARSALDQISNRGSPNKRRFEDRQTRCLENYDKYQQVWYQNLSKNVRSRERLNEPKHSVNHKYNMLYSQRSGDIMTV